ncbi:hypothetical protein E3N88_09351 [Mikania micrantha]|uniref:Uncharacterized protein n=1 Tax=Mikania micrantha TaxID=192012 RepID=A0A5N6PLW0_9ASTR|nr:hypothetical protein E3N88_09351 [Mikania micrantha]
MNDYEKSRLMRIEENRKKLRELGVKSIANSLTSLVESQKLKKKIVKSSNMANDVDYVPDMGDDIESDHQQVSTRSKKQHRSHYIAPLSMNKFANLAKQNRVIAPKVSQKYPLDSDASKDKHFKATVTMAELISCNKGPQRQMEVFKKKLTRPNCINGGQKDDWFLLTKKMTNDVDQNDEYEDMDDMTFVDNENQIQMDDSENDLGNEDDVLIQEQLQGSKLQKAIESKKRGPTMLHVVHTRKVDDRDVIICNEFGQPVGPVTNEKDIVGRFSRFLGTIARNHSYASLIHSSWHKVPHKDKIWEYVLVRFKKRHFYQFKDDKTRWKNRPKSIPEGDFANLLRLWNNTNVKINDDPNKELPTLTKMFEHTRKRTEGRAYVDTYDDTERKIEQMKNYKSSENENASADPFMIVMNKENSGYCRLYGRGVTNRLIKEINDGDTTYTFPGGLMESFNASFEGEKHELVEMRKKLDEEHERKRTELDAIQLDIKNQQEHLEATMRKLMEQLPHKD